MSLFLLFIDFFLYGHNNFGINYELKRYSMINSQFYLNWRVTNNIIVLHLYYIT